MRVRGDAHRRHPELIPVPIGPRPGGGGGGDPAEIAAIERRLAALEAGGGGSGAALLSLSAFIASSAGAQVGAAKGVDSANGVWDVNLVLTAVAPRAGFELPAGRTLTGVVVHGVDMRASFDATVGNARRFVMNVDGPAGALDLRIETEASA